MGRCRAVVPRERVGEVVFGALLQPLELVMFRNPPRHGIEQPNLR